MTLSLDILTVAYLCITSVYILQNTKGELVPFLRQQGNGHFFKITLELSVEVKTTHMSCQGHSLSLSDPGIECSSNSTIMHPVPSKEATHMKPTLLRFICLFNGILDCSDNAAND
jgi:hypothetical protein